MKENTELMILYTNDNKTQEKIHNQFGIELIKRS